MSITVSASQTYGHSCKNLNEVGEHWRRNLSCDIHSMGHPPYLDRTSLEKFELHDIAFRFKDMTKVCILTCVSEKWYINNKYLCDFGIATVSPTPTEIDIFRSL